MSEGEVVSALVADIYDAALNPKLWPDALGKAARFIGGLGAGLYAKDASTKTGNIFYHDGAIDPHYVALYFDKYVKLDPSTTGHYFAEIEKPVAPHVRRAVLIGRTIELKTAEAAGFADAFDGLGAGMFMVDATGRIVHANAAGHAMLAAGEPLRAAGDRLTAGDPTADQALLDIFTAAGSGDTAIGIKGIAVPLTASDGGRHVAHVLPLTSGARRRAG